MLLFTGNIPRGVFCEQSSQKTRELWREIMQSMISVHREARYCERSGQQHSVNTLTLSQEYTIIKKMSHRFICEIFTDGQFMKL